MNEIRQPGTIRGFSPPAATRPDPARALRMEAC